MMVKVKEFLSGFLAWLLVVALVAIPITVGISIGFDAATISLPLNCKQAKE